MSDFPIQGTTEQVLAYCKAMAEMQAEFTSVPKNATAAVGKAGERKFKFTDYDCLVEYLRPIFAKHGFFHFACPGSVATKIVAVLHADSGALGEVDSSLASGTVTLAHRDGAMVTASFAMPCADPRDAGKIITYFRRYALASLAGVSSDEDTDAEGVGNHPPQQAQKARQEPAKQQAKAQPSGEPNAAAGLLEELKTFVASIATSPEHQAELMRRVAAHSRDAHGSVPSELAKAGASYKLDSVLRWARATWKDGKDAEPAKDHFGSEEDYERRARAEQNHDGTFGEMR